MPMQLTLLKNEIHLWTTKPLTIFSNESEQLLTEKYKALLTPDELKRQQRYKFEKDQHSALITRAFIRDLLSHYADVDPKDWRFIKGDKDKPEIENPPLPLKFNISHTEGLIICAVTLNDDIGCDVENTERSNDVLSIADRFFSVQETNALFALPKEQQRDRFFDYWTLKESYIKAWGLGLAIPLKDFSFTLSNASTLTSSKVNDDISLSFAAHRVDTAVHWRSWLLYPDKLHRIAVSLKGKIDNQGTNFSFRYFESIPLVSAEETETI